MMQAISEQKFKQQKTDYEFLKTNFCVFISMRARWQFFHATDFTGRSSSKGIQSTIDPPPPPPPQKSSPKKRF